MKIIESIEEMRNFSREQKKIGKRIGFVPTMGYLHEGHLSLISKGKELSDLVVVSIFVNPIQFSPGEDYESYPRDLKRDCQLLEGVGCDCLFIPSVQEMYPPGFLTSVQVEKITMVLCGASRPGHFKGVTTVVCKLFNIIEPDLAVFGQKDAQQAVVIKRMVKDLNLDIEIIVSPTVRESDGLAMSSRNVYLSEEERRDATVLFQALKEANARIEKGERNPLILKSFLRQMIENKKTAEIDYIEIVDGEELQEIDILKGKVLIALAVKFGKARLIDNLFLEVPG